MTKIKKLFSVLFIPIAISSLMTYKVHAADSKDDVDHQATQAHPTLINFIPYPSLWNDITKFDSFTNLDEFFKVSLPVSVGMASPSVIKVDISENDVAFTLRAEIPGTKKEDVKVHIEGNRVSIRAETKQEKEKKEGERVIRREIYSGSSSRNITLSSYVDESRVEAKFENGRLELLLPKKKGGNSKQIEIN